MAKKQPLTVKFLKICSENFYRDTDRRVVFKFREIWPTENRWNRVLFTRQKQKKISPGSPAVATARIWPEIYQGQPPTMYSYSSRFPPNRFTFVTVIAERVNIATTRRKVKLIFGWSLEPNDKPLSVRTTTVAIPVLRCCSNPAGWLAIQDGD